MRNSQCGARGSKKAKPELGDPTDPLGMAVLAENYLEWLAVHNYSPQTIHQRRYYLGYFSEWCTERGLRQPRELTKQIVERYQRWLYHFRRSDNQQPLTFRTQVQRLTGVKAWLKWLTRQNYLLYNPAAELELPRGERRLPRTILSVAEVEALLALADGSTLLRLRDRAMLETLYSTGIRRQELVRLKIYDLDLVRRTLMVRQGKGHIDRLIPIGARALAWVDKYLQEVRPQLARLPDEGDLFLTAGGESIMPASLSALVHSYFQRIGKTASCHAFRHTMATLMLENGADIRYIQEMLGHAHLKTTSIYTHVSISQLQAIHTATHPAHWPAAAKIAEPSLSRQELLDSLAAEAEADLEN